MTICDICEGEHSANTPSCEICNKVVSKYQNKTKYSMKEVRKALHKAYSHKDEEEKQTYFHCKYTEIISKFNSQSKTLGTFDDAFILTLDHKNSGNKELVVSLNIINKMKGDIPHDKFKEIVIALGNHFDTENDTNDERLEEILGYTCPNCSR